jgi:RES domain-containing protein
MRAVSGPLTGLSVIVPSIVTDGRDAIVVVNPDHPDARRISVGLETPVVRDPRLFGP